MSDMKLIMENWKKCLNEVEAPPLGDEERAALEEFLKGIMAISLAADAAQAETEGQIEEGRATTRKRQKKERQQRTKMWKQMANVTGIKIADFTPAQKAEYQKVKSEFLEKEQEGQDQAVFNFQNALMHGNLLDAPGVKELVALGGAPLTAVLTYAFQLCSTNLSLTCLWDWLQGQYTG
jgi:hypothetical protein